MNKINAIVDRYGCLLDELPRSSDFTVWYHSTYAEQSRRNISATVFLICERVRWAGGNEARISLRRLSSSSAMWSPPIPLRFDVDFN
jgi:hypothetical protein